MIAQLSNIQQFFAAHLSDVLDWGKHVRPDPERKTNGDAAYVLIDTGLNRYKVACLSSYIEPPAGASYQCKALGTVTFDDFGGQKHMIEPKCDATWAEISKHIHVRELTDGLAIARRELAEASPEAVGAVRVRVAELVARAQKWGVEAKGLPESLVAASVGDLMSPKVSQASQFSMEELAAAPKHHGVPIFTVDDLRTSGVGPVKGDQPFLGAPIIFITNPGEGIAGMTEIQGWCVRVHSDETISAFITPDHSEANYKDKLQRRNPAKNIRSNCWDFNERLMAPFRMAGEVERLAARVAELEQSGINRTKLMEMQQEAHEIKSAAQTNAADPAKRRPGRPSNAEKAAKAAETGKDEKAA